jgi:hypothetical protein
MKLMDMNEVLDKLKSLKDNAKALVVVFSVVLLLDGFVLVRAQFIPLMRMWSKASKVKADILQAGVDSKSETVFKSRLSDLNTEMANLNKKVVAEEELPQALETISKFAGISTVKILKIRPMSEARHAQKTVKVSNEEELVREKISVTAIAGFTQLGRFLALIENSPVFFDVRKLEIRAGSQENMKHSVTIFLDVILRKS